MDEIVQFGRRKIGDLTIELQTNGVFGGRTLGWIKKNVALLWISADGPIEINDINRRTRNSRGTGKIIEKNIRKLMSEDDASPVQVGIRSTIGRFNVYRQKEIIDYYSNLGIKAIYVDQICDVVGGADSRKGSVEIDAITFASEFLDAYEYAGSKGVFYGTIATMNFDEPVEVACRSLVPTPHLMPDGYVSACEMCYSVDSPLSIFIYGKWNPDRKVIEYDDKKINSIRTRNIYNLADCQGCEYLRNCAGGCAGESLNETGGYLKKNERLCVITRYLASRMKLNNGLYPYLHP